MSSPSHLHADKDSHNANLAEMLKMFQRFLGQKSSEAEMGQNMLALGSKTELVQRFEDLMINPMNALLKSKNEIDKSMINAVDSFMRYYIAKTKEKKVIGSAFRRIERLNSLYYGIILVDDSFENREDVFSFLDFYNSLDFAQAVPVVFQFIPQELSNKFAHEEYID